jgi:predicted amidophosphoribosyltransferase
LSRSSVVALGRAAAGFFLPSRCLACTAGEVDECFQGGICRACWDALPPRESASCEVCGELVLAAQTRTCGRCLLDPPAFDRLLAAAPYRGSARAILLAFKFRGADYLGPRLASAMLRRLPRPAGCREVAAVPATARARRARGYHPAAVLAGAVAEGLGLPFRRGLLHKVRDTLVQSRVPASQRAANVRGAFRVRARPSGGVLLVDDVATSGATARECARRLADAGAPSITVWCFARSSRLDVAAEAP